MPTLEAKLMIEEPEAAPLKKSPPKSTTETTEPKRSLGSLDAIRKKVTALNKANGVEAKELTDEELRLCWGKFIEKLKERKNHSAVTNFKMATLRIIDNNSIEIVSFNNIQQKFIEQERAELIEDFQQYFCNRQLIYNVIIEESEEQYLKIIEEYPLVKELKDRLRLELD